MDFLVDPVFLFFVFGLFLAVLALWRRWLAGAFLLGFGVVVLYFLSTGPGVDLLLRPLEGRFPALLSPPEAQAIVVLSGGESYADARPVPSTLSPSTLARLVEGVRLFRLLGEKPTLWFVGGAGFEGEGIPLMAQTAQELGVPREKMRWLTASRNTWEDAALVAQNLGPFPFILVTSAFHMPRALESFHAHGLNPIPAPCDYRAFQARSVKAFLPSSQALFSSALALREYSALFWYRLRYLRV